MAVEWCKSCRDRGRLSMAHHEVAGTPMCDECFGGKPSNGMNAQLAAEVLKKKAEEQPMAKRTSEEVKAAIVKDHANGMGTNAIATKHGVAWITAKTIIGGDGPKRAGGAKKAGLRSLLGNPGSAAPL